MAHARMLLYTLREMRRVWCTLLRGAKLCVVRSIGPSAQGIDKAALVKEVKQALYASKICSYAQGLNIIKAKSAEKQWNVDIGSMARIWKVQDVALGDLNVAGVACCILQRLQLEQYVPVSMCFMACRKYDG